MKMSPHEQTAAFAALSESLDRHSRRRLREALEVPTTDELSQQDLFALARAEIQALSDAEKRRAHERKEQGGDTKGGVKGVKLFVQDTATMGAYNFEVGGDFKLEHAPRLMGFLEACIQSLSYDKEIKDSDPGPLPCGDRPAALGAGGGGSSTATSSSLQAADVPTAGLYFTGCGGVVRVWADGSEEGQVFRTHGRGLAYAEAVAHAQKKRSTQAAHLHARRRWRGGVRVAVFDSR